MHVTPARTGALQQFLQCLFPVGFRLRKSVGTRFTRHEVEAVHIPPFEKVTSVETPFLEDTSHGCPLGVQLCFPVPLEHMCHLQGGTTWNVTGQHSARQNFI